MAYYLDIKIYPNQSLTPKGLLLLMFLITIPASFIGITFFILGAWPVLGFMGLEVLLIYIAFKVLFYKTSITVSSFYINVAKPLINSDSNIYFLRTRYHFDAANSAEDFGLVNVTIFADCSLESVTAPASISDQQYTFKTPA